MISTKVSNPNGLLERHLEWTSTMYCRRTASFDNPSTNRELTRKPIGSSLVLTFDLITHVQNSRTQSACRGNSLSFKLNILDKYTGSWDMQSKRWPNTRMSSNQSSCTTFVRL